ncbi:MAG: hypothetical protein COV52_09195 [Gammaproteobacteria bacterium CG11_big_fil_rev_8_21_14_0_20_46_22]|nr:MAG: hypothetical protein COW05_06935 [Gammaproteobacteria bacterium CG12_big_fil_rev_8_21_14_0_65_46_12]PIR10307.1 MAG: hypothetical protein COV52_09195 [Gammaproteobacteria bacterium CG11_big_fil_rev_8_21_14_0_20_46_22]
MAKTIKPISVIPDIDEHYPDVLQGVRKEQKRFATHDESTQHSPKDRDPVQEQGLAQGMPQHPLLGGQKLAGTFPDDMEATPLASENPEAREKLELRLRQKLELQQRLQAQHQQTISFNRG